MIEGSALERDLLKDLVDWKGNRRRKPLIVNGARQVGKTWLLQEFGKKYFENVVYINFDNDPIASGFFNEDFDVDRILKAISIYKQVQIVPEKTLLIFDEIQTTPKAVTSLKYFCENASEYVVVAAGSLLGLQQHFGTGWPVGKVDTLNLYPLNFTEFLKATGNNDLLEVINSGDVQMMTSFKDKLIQILKQYYVVGGMPEVVSTFLDTNSFDEVRNLQKQILNDYQFDFSKHVPTRILQRTNEVWNSIPNHLARENKKFVFGHIKNGARAKQYEESIDWLEQAGLIFKIPRINRPGFPLKSYVDGASFKVYLLDVGLLGAMSELSPKAILDKNILFTEFKGALTEQYLCQQLISCCGVNPFYWSNQNSSGEVDFVFTFEDNIFAAEVKAEENLRSRSLRAFHDKFKESCALRFSLSDFRVQEWMRNIPLYACINTGFWK